MSFADINAAVVGVGFIGVAHVLEAVQRSDAEARWVRVER